MNENLSDILRFLKSKKITARFIAQKTTVSEGYISDMKNGRKTVSPAFADNLFKEFKNEIEEFKKVKSVKG